MKKIFFFFLLCFAWVGNISSQQNIYTVQGHERTDITQVKPTKSGQKISTLKSSSNFTFDDVQFWVGEGENRAMLVIDWYLDGSQTLVWGYKWSGQARGLDMVMAIANADPRLTFLTHFTGSLGNTIAGFGYDIDGKGSQCLIFENNTNSPVCPSNGIVTTTAYNYDFWTTPDPNDYWRSGWYEGYWSYQIKDNINDEFLYSPVGASTRELQDGSVDGWAYQDGWESWEGVIPKTPYTAALASVTGVSLNKEMLTLELGSEYTLIKTIAPANASNKAVIWHSTNTDVATISESGVIKAISTGKATITTTTVDGGYSASCQLNVVISAKGLTVSPKETALEVGNSHKLSAKINPESATNKNVSWSSSDASVVTVDQEGRITAVQAGVTKIYATTEDGEYTDYCLVTVTGDIPSEMEVPNDSTVIISFSKIEKADRYYVYVYRLENSSQILESTQTLDKSGNLVDEKVNLRAASDLLSTILIRKDKASSYLVKVDAVQSVSGYEVIISTHQSSISNPVANELIPATPTSVIYHEGKLEIMNMNNYMAHIVGIDGKVWDSVQITNDSYYHPLKLAPGIYVFSGVNGKKKVTEKFVVR